MPDFYENSVKNCARLERKAHGAKKKKKLYEIIAKNVKAFRIYKTINKTHQDFFLTIYQNYTLAINLP